VNESSVLLLLVTRHTAVCETFCCHAIDEASAILSTDTGSSHRPLYRMSINYSLSVWISVHQFTFLAVTVKG